MEAFQFISALVGLLSGLVTIFVFAVFVWNRIRYTPRFTVEVSLERESAHEKLPGVEKSLVITYQHHLRQTVRLTSVTVLYSSSEITFPIQPTKPNGVKLARHVGVNPVKSKAPPLACEFPMQMVLPAGEPKVRLIVPICWTDGTTRANIEILLRAAVDEAELAGLAGMFGAPIKVQRTRTQIYRG